MKTYKNRSGKKSGVTAYEIGNDFIIVQFNYSKKYRYTYHSAGRKAVETMKSLALARKGLSTFISQNQPGYE